MAGGITTAGTAGLSEALADGLGIVGLLAVAFAFLLLYRGRFGK